MFSLKINSVWTLILCLASCSGTDSRGVAIGSVGDSARVLFVDNTRAFASIPQDSLFEARYDVVPLETNVESLISQIGRISIYGNNFYVLDRSSGSVLIFDEQGKFLKKISHIGRGPGEYTSLTDFGIDTKNNNIVLYCDRPKKIIVYALEEDKWQGEMSVDQLFESISVDPQTGFLTGINRMPVYKDCFFRYDFHKKAKGKSFVPITANKTEKMFLNYRSEFPFWIKSRHDYCVVPYVSTIHKMGRDSLEKPFHLRFGTPFPDIEGEGKTSGEWVRTAIGDNLGFWYANFREYETYLTFTFGRGTKVFYPKDGDRYTVFDFLENKDYHYPHSYHFAHDHYDGNEDNRYIFVEQSPNLVRFYSELKNNSPSDWEKIDDRAKGRIAKMKVEDNPVLFVYRLKE